MPVCLCCSGKPFNECCEPFIKNIEKPTLPEQLMRSRYTAYALLHIDYIEQTMQGAAIEGFSKDDALKWAQRIKWQGLEIIHSSTDKIKGLVEFKAHFFDGQKSHTLHEISEFKLIDDVWFYTDGKTPVSDKKDTVAKVGRNDPCPCGSGKKFKKCCAH